MPKDIFSLNKQTAQRLMKIKGNVRGEGLLTDISYIRSREGERGVRAIEERLKEVGCSVQFDEIQPFRWCPVEWNALMFLATKEIFNWSDQDIFNMGVFSAKISFVVKILMKYLLSPQKVFEQVPKYWRKNYDFGELIPYQIDETEKYGVLRLKRFKVHPIMCINIAGYIVRVTQYTVRSDVSIKETKCMHKGEPYHEFLVTWK